MNVRVLQYYRRGKNVELMNMLDSNHQFGVLVVDPRSKGFRNVDFQLIFLSPLDTLLAFDMFDFDK